MSFSKRDAILVAQARNFADVLSADPEAYNVSLSMAASVSDAVNAYIASHSALVEARANGVRSEPMTADRNVQRAAMRDLIRPIYSAVQASRAISDQQKIALGVHVPATRRTRQARPRVAPMLSVTKVDGWVVSLRVHDPDQPERRARAEGTKGISIFTAIGAEPPADASGFKFEDNIGRVDTKVTFSPSLALGETVWFAASYFNNRKESGPMCRPVRAMIGAGSSMPAPVGMLSAARADAA